MVRKVKQWDILVKKQMKSEYKAVKMTSSDNNKAELLYNVAAGGGDLIKTSKIKYLAWPKLPVLNN